MINKKTLGYAIAAFLIIWFVLYIVSTQILGIPLWWISRRMVPFSLLPEPISRFNVTITPVAPTTIGEKVLVIVLNASDQAPVEGAMISLGKNGDHIHDYYTNANGQAEVEYVGEVTIIQVNKTDFKTVLEAIPEAPAKWVRDQNIAKTSDLA